ncbi:MAG: ABC transporter substrate-binding protein [Acetivibrio sp.]
MREGKRGISLLLIFLLVVPFFQGCKKTLEEESAIAIQENTSSGTTTDACVLRVVTMMGEEDPNAVHYNQVLEEFTKSHPNVTITDSSVSSDNDWKVQMEADFVMDNEPDVIQYFTDASATNILKTNKFVTLEEMQKEDPRIGANASFIALEQTKSPLDKVNYAVPTTGYWEGLFCNKDIFERYDVEFPSTWNKLLKAIKVFKKHGVVPIAAALNDIPNYWIESLLLNASTKEEYLSVPEEAPASWIKGLSKIKELYEVGAFSEDAAIIDNEMAGKMFQNKQAAMQLEGSWYLNGIKDQSNTIVCEFPQWEGAKMEKGSAIQGFSSGFYITKRAWGDPIKQKAALDFVYANTCDEQVIKYWGGSGICSVPVPEKGRFTKLQKSGMVYATGITNPVSPIDSRIAPEAFNELKNQIVPIALGQISAKDGINKMLKINNR